MAQYRHEDGCPERGRPAHDVHGDLPLDARGDPRAHGKARRLPRAQKEVRVASSTIITATELLASTARYCRVTTPPLLHPIQRNSTCPPMLGSRGWVGLRLDVGEIDWERSR